LIKKSVLFIAVGRDEKTGRGRREPLGDISGQGYPAPTGKHNPGK